MTPQQLKEKIKTILTSQGFHTSEFENYTNTNSFHVSKRRYFNFNTKVIVRKIQSPHNVEHFTIEIEDINPNSIPYKFIIKHTHEGRLIFVRDLPI